MKSVWQNVTIAESDQTIVVESGEKHSTCPWKGIASYYHVKMNNTENKDAAWYYQEPKDAAKNIKDHIAFYKRNSSN